MPCGVPCDMVPCKAVRCEKLLGCGHQCPSICGEECPTPKHCQQCASDDILDRIVDYIMYSSYRDADVNSEPIIILPCDHFFKVETLDGHVGLKSYYHINEAGEILGPKLVDAERLKGCPDCRAPLLSIHRYNRAVKAALLDESTRRFIANSTKQHTEYMRKVETWELNLEKVVAKFKTDKAAGLVSQTETLKDYKNQSSRYLTLLQSYLNSVETEQQPYGRVQSMVVNAKRRHNVESKFEIDKSAIQHGSHIRGRCLRLRLVFSVLWNYKELAKLFEKDMAKKVWDTILEVDLKATIKDCEAIAEDCLSRKFMREACETKIFLTQFDAIRLLNPTFAPDEPEGSREERRKTHLEWLEVAREHIRRMPSCAYLAEEVEKAEKLLRGAVFYNFVTSEERMEVMRAMTREFSGSGHWYNCVNGHPVCVGSFDLSKHARKLVDADDSRLVYDWRMWGCDGELAVPRVRGACWRRTS